jgi:fatty acid desaturase
MKKQYQEVYPIPSGLNSVIIGICTGLYGYLMWQGSHLDNPWMFIPVSLFFALVMVPVYSLIHEAEHGILFAGRRINYLAGIHLCNLFIAPFTFFRHCHLNHHKHNRTDKEMWDLYYEHQNRLLRYGNLYLMMIGFGYLMLPLSVLLSAVDPRLLYLRIFTSHTEIKGFLEGSKRPDKLSKIRLESFVVILFQALLYLLLQLKPLPYIAMLLVHGFLWSSQNYVNHAFSPRDIINGAHNHRMSKWFKYIYLNFNIHLAHHQNPLVPWVHLYKFIKSDRERISFLKAYLRLWHGPRLTDVKSPHESPGNKT